MIAEIRDQSNVSPYLSQRDVKVSSDGQSEGFDITWTVLYTDDAIAEHPLDVWLNLIGQNRV